MQFKTKIVKNAKDSFCSNCIVFIQKTIPDIEFIQKQTLEKRPHLMR